MSPQSYGAQNGKQMVNVQLCLAVADQVEHGLDQDEAHKMTRGRVRVKSQGGPEARIRRSSGMKLIRNYYCSSISDITPTKGDCYNYSNSDPDLNRTSRQGAMGVRHSKPSMSMSAPLPQQSMMRIKMTRRQTGRITSHDSTTNRLKSMTVFNKSRSSLSQDMRLPLVIIAAVILAPLMIFNTGCQASSLHEAQVPLRANLQASGTNQRLQEAEPAGE